jgi:hypothetical protein
MNPMRVLTAVRLGLVLALFSVVLAGCGSAEAPTADVAKAPKTSDRPGYTGHPELPPLSSLSPWERGSLTGGKEANSKVFNEVASVVHAYLDARAEGDWELACSYVSPKAQRLLQGSAESEGKGPGGTSCPAALPGRITGSPEERQNEASFTDVGSVRVFRSGGGKFRSAFVNYRVGNALRVMALDTAPSWAWGVDFTDPIKIGPE